MPILQARPQNPAQRRAAAQAKVKGRLTDVASAQLQALQQLQAQCLRLINNHPAGLDPQEVADGMGDDMGEILAANDILVKAIEDLAALYGVNNPKIAYPKNNYTVAPNGTVTFLDEPFGSTP